MKKLICLIMTVSFFLLCTLSGCNKNSNADTVSIVSDTVSTIPQSWGKNVQDGIYDSGIFFDFPENSSVTADLHRGIMFIDISVVQKDKIINNVRLFDIAHSKELLNKSFDSGNRRLGQLENGDFYELSFTDGSVTEYAVNGHKKTYKLKNDIQLLDGLISPDGDYLLCQKRNSDDKPCFLFNIKSQKEISVVSDVPFGNIIGSDKSAFYLEDFENKIWKIGHDGVGTVINGRCNSRLTLPYITECNEVGYIVQNLATNDLQSFGADTEKDYIVSAGNGFLLSNTDNGYKIYSLGDGRYTDLFKLEGTYMTAVYSNEGYFAVLTARDNKLCMYFLVTSELQYTGSFLNTGGTYEEFECAYFDKVNIDSKTQEKIENIYKDYNVRVILKSSRFEENILNYKCKPVKDSDINSKVEAVQSFLSLFPKEMMREINDGADIWLYLCNDLQNIDGGRASGFASVFSGHPFVAAESCGKDIYFEELLAHEFCHLFDYGISQDWINGWENLSPKDGYCRRLLNIPGKYSLHNTDGSEVYFYDIYSTTFPAEDRATVFQKLFYEYASGEKLPELHSGHLAKKVSYYGKMLRANYPSCNKSDQLFWE